METLVKELNRLGFDVQLKHVPTEGDRQAGMVCLKTEAGVTLLEHATAQSNSNYGEFQQGSGYATWLRALPAPTSPTFAS